MSDSRSRRTSGNHTLDCMTSSYVLTPIAPAVADELRSQGGVPYIADVQPGFPCRQCLRDADVGDELILVSYDPFTTDSPYRSASPIFLHSAPCESPGATDALPPQLTSRQLSVRAFDEDEMMIDAAVIDGSALADTIERFLVDPATDRVHVHNATRGCWAVRVDRR